MAFGSLGLYQNWISAENHAVTQFERKVAFYRCQLSPLQPAQAADELQANNRFARATLQSFDHRPFQLTAQQNNKKIATTVYC